MTLNYLIGKYGGNVKDLYCGLEFDHFVGYGIRLAMDSQGPAMIVSYYPYWGTHIWDTSFALKTYVYITGKFLKCASDCPMLWPMALKWLEYGVSVQCCLLLMMMIMGLNWVQLGLKIFLVGMCRWENEKWPIHLPNFDPKLEPYIYQKSKICLENRLLKKNYDPFIYQNQGLRRGHSFTRGVKMGPYSPPFPGHHLH